MCTEFCASTKFDGAPALVAVDGHIDALLPRAFETEDAEFEPYVPGAGESRSALQHGFIHHRRPAEYFAGANLGAMPVAAEYLPYELVLGNSTPIHRTQSATLRYGRV